jgi:hypothetical protein
VENKKKFIVYLYETTIGKDKPYTIEAETESEAIEKVANEICEDLKVGDEEGTMELLLKEYTPLELIKRWDMELRIMDKEEAAKWAQKKFEEIDFVVKGNA